MVTQYGMTERLGAIKLGTGDAEPFLGRDFGHQRDYSEDIAAIVDEEVSKLISNAHQEAFDILTENRDVLDDLVRALFEKETLDREEVADVFQPLKLWPKRPAWTGSDRRVPSKLPPVTPPPSVVQGTNGHHAINGPTARTGPATDTIPPGRRCRPAGHRFHRATTQCRPSRRPATQPGRAAHQSRVGSRPYPGPQAGSLDPNRPETWPPPTHPASPAGPYSGGAAPGQPGTEPEGAVQPPRGPDFDDARRVVLPARLAPSTTTGSSPRSARS